MWAIFQRRTINSDVDLRGESDRTSDIMPLYQDRVETGVQGRGIVDD